MKGFKYLNMQIPPLLLNDTSNDFRRRVLVIFSLGSGGLRVAEMHGTGRLFR